jgi:ABC-type Fe3+/spermidine/putrescine transport system ATPase subunit
MLFQSYGLFPHMNVAGNVGFGLRMRGVARAERDRRVGSALRMTRIEELTERFPAQLSGGQQQRVALARAIVTEPDILLLDEPFGALDQALREHMQVELRKLQRSLMTTTLVVTHDQREALMLSDLIAVMNAGNIEQFGAPSDVYDRPATRFVASFMGVENLLEATVEDGCVRAGPLAVANVAGPAQASAIPVTLAFRADAVLIEPPGATDSAPAHVVFSSNRGSTVLYELALADDRIVLAAEQRHGGGVRAPGSAVAVRVVASACSVLTA